MSSPEHLECTTPRAPERVTNKYQIMDHKIGNLLEAISTLYRAFQEGGYESPEERHEKLGHLRRLTEAFLAELQEASRIT